MPEQGKKCNIPYLKVSPESIFSEMIRANKKAFIFQQGNCTMNVLHPSLSKSFVLSIYSRNSMKNSTLGYFCRSTYRQMHRKLQLWWLFRRWLMCSVHPNITSYVLFAKVLKYIPKKWLLSSISQNKFEK